MKTKETSTYKTKGLEFYITNAESIDHAVKSFIHYRINVTRNDIELFEGELPKQANVMSAIMPAFEDNSTKSSRELALDWWNDLPVWGKCSKEYYMGFYFANDNITSEKIEQIWSCETGKDKMFHKSNTKQFKEFNPELFKAYINKFSDEDKIKAIRSILPDLKIGLYINYVQEEDKSYWVFNSERIIVK